MLAFRRCLFCWHVRSRSTDKNKTFRKDSLKKKIDQYKTPGEFLTIDETMVAFRGRIAFMQYIPGKRHKYGIKLFKTFNEKS